MVLVGVDEEALGDGDVRGAVRVDRLGDETVFHLEEGRKRGRARKLTKGHRRGGTGGGVSGGKNGGTRKRRKRGGMRKVGEGAVAVL